MDRKKILIADPIDIHRSILTSFLCDSYGITSVNNYARATDILTAEGSDISLVMVGLSPPVDSGLGLLEHMKEAGLVGVIPAIVVLDQYETIPIARANMLGAAEYIFQPFCSTIIKQRVANLIQLYAARGQMAEAPLM